MLCVFPACSEKTHIAKYHNGMLILYHCGIILSRGAIEIIFRLKELREKRHMSQVRFGVELDLNQNVISRYENLEREADYQTLLDIADFFNVSLDYLFGRTDNPKINE